MLLRRLVTNAYYNLFDYSRRFGDRACNSRAYAFLACSYCENGRFDYAEKMFKKAAKLEPHNPQIFTNYAVSLTRMGKKEEAIQYYHNIEKKQEEIGLAVERQLEKGVKVIKVLAPEKPVDKGYIDLDSIGDD